MDWRFNTIWFDKLDQSKIFWKDFKEKVIKSENKIFENSEYATLWHLKDKLYSFDTLCESDSLLYLELIWANVKDFEGIKKFRNLKRLELLSCVKLESDRGLSQISDSLEFLYISGSKKFKFSNELLKLKKLKVLCLNRCGSIESLDFLGEFPNLIDFRFVDTNVLDGNLNPILEHPTIRAAGFLNKRHYNLKDDKLELELRNKFPDAYKTVVYNGEYSTFRYEYE